MIAWRMDDSRLAAAPQAVEVPVIGPPVHFCFDLSLRVRSGLMTSHFCPPSRVRKMTWAPW